METKVLYRIKPVDKKSIELLYDVYRENPDGTIVGWYVTELYRWGQAFVESEDELPYLESKTFTGSPNVGDGCDLEDTISVDFYFDDEIPDEEKQEIEDSWYEGGLGWLVDGEHEWQIEDESITIYGPFVVDKLTYVDYNLVSEERIELKPRPPIDPNSAWPF